MKEDHEFNIKFVKAVERHRLVYDFTLIDYNNKEKQEEAWVEIANQMGASVNECKERWRNLRACLTRHVKRKFGKKPYYMTEHMQFVVPFTKTRSRALLPFVQDGLEDFFTSAELECSGSSIKDDIIEDPTSKDDLDSGLDLLGEPSSVEGDLSPLDIAVADEELSRKRPNSPEESESSNGEYFENKRLREEVDLGDADVNFFSSLLPDVHLMNAAQKRKMRIGILKLIDEILT